MIQGKLINLRPIREEELEKVYRFETDLRNRGEFYPLQISSEYGFRQWYHNTNGLWSDEYGRILITDKQDRIVGHVDYFKTVPYFHALELAGIVYKKEDRKQGYASEALDLFCDYLFKTKPINRLEVRIDPRHLASQKVVEKIGFIYEGIAREAIQKGPEYGDLKIYALIRHEYYALKE